MMEELKKDITNLRLEMKETKILIRDYNGLRQNINNTNKKNRGVRERKVDTPYR